MNKKFINHLQTALSCYKADSDLPVEISGFSNITGGDINQAFKLELVDSCPLFIKLNIAQKLSMFEAEGFALDTIYSSKSIKSPRPITSGVFAGKSYLIMEFLEFGSPNQNTPVEFARQLAKMHKFTNDKFGFAIDNTIGSTPQYNSLKSNWTEFWRDNRIEPQLRMAEKRGAPKDLRLKADKLLSRLDQFFEKEPVASLLHGDLWSGNHATDKDGNPVIYDPASYYGDRECDIAMTELFGRCPTSFYAAYNEVWPLADGYTRRRTLYNWYHIINHFNLFGGGYAAQAKRMLDSLL